MLNRVPLNLYQLTFYYEWKLNPSRIDYHMVLDQEIEGNLDIPRLNKSLNKLISQYFILNSCVEEIDGAYYWKENEYIQELEYFDSDNILESIKNFIAKPFDLEKEPLYRYAIFKLDVDKYRFIYINQHILVDGLSAIQGYSEISNFYNDENYYCKVSLDDQKNNIINLSNYLKTEYEKNKDKCIQFWKRQIADLEGVNIEFLYSTSDKFKNELESIDKIQSCFGIEGIEFSLEKDTYEKFCKIKNAFPISPYLFSKIIYAITIFKYTEQKNFCISYPIAIKEGITLEYGANVNTNIFPFKLNDDLNVMDIFSSAKSFIQSLKDGDIKYGYFPLYDYISKNNIDLINLTFSSTSLQNILLNLNGLICKKAFNSNISMINDFIFEFESTDIGINFRTMYKNNIISKSLLENFCKVYQYVYSQITDDIIGYINGKNLKKISEYSLVSIDDFNVIMDKFNNNKKINVNKKTIHEMFEAQVLKTPNDIALICDRMKLTYNELNQRANQLGNFLQKNFEIKPDILIALCLNRNEHMLISMLAILKAGGAYIPIDPEYPKDRLDFILKDTDTKLLLTNEKFRENFLDYTALNIVYVDSYKIEKCLLNEKNKNLDSSSCSHDLSYVIYTSGTTGQPKGVLIEHVGVVNLIESQGKFIEKEFNKQSINVLWFANYVFDAHVWELSSSIFHGHCLHLISDEIRKDIYLLSQYIIENKIHAAMLPPSYLNTEVVLDLKLAMFAGDKTNKQILQFYLDRNVKVVNAYGPTETTVICYTNKFENADEVNSIGKLVKFDRGLVLNQQLKPLPIGALGELYVGGIGIARGYLNRPELTAEKFIGNPFQTSEEKSLNFNSRLYKTGDLVKMLPNGKLEYVCRNDNQVKLRGFRIELGEIESRIMGFKEIKQAVVVAKDLCVTDIRNSGNKVLICYYVAKNEIPIEEFIEHILQKLPDYMMPSFFVRLDKLPLNVNGKLDKKALPSPEISKSNSYVAPRSDTENKLCTIWESVLGLPKNSVGIQDDFFRLGGDSIISIQIVGQIRQKLGIEINVKDIFKYKSIENLGYYFDRINKNCNIHFESEQGTLTGSFPLLPIQKLFFANEFFNSKIWSHSFLVKTPQLDIKKLTNAINNLVEYHDCFRVLFKNENNDLIQYYNRNIKIDQIHQLNINSLMTKKKNNQFEENIDDILRKWQNNFNFENGPLFSFGYIYGFKDQSARIFVAAHHLIIDPQSWKIITEDLYSLYNGISLGEKCASYRQWGKYLEKYSKLKDTEKQFWNNLTLSRKNCNDILLKKTSHFIEKNKNRNISVIRLNEESTQKLLKECNKLYYTEINEILLTGICESIHKLFGISMLSILLEKHERESIDSVINIKKTVGQFSKLYPVYFEICEDLNKNLINVKENLRITPNKGFCIESVRAYDAEDLPLISYNYLNFIKDDNKSWEILNDKNRILMYSNEFKNNILSINVAIIDNSLLVEVNSILVKDLTEKISQEIENSLIRIILNASTHCRSFLTASDVNYLVNSNYLEKIQRDKEITSIFKVNSLQQGFISHYLKNNNLDDSYFIQIIWKYFSKIDVSYLKKSWEIATNKHEALRLRFAWDEEIIQIIDKESDLDWHFKDLSHYSDNALQMNLFKKFQEDDRMNKFDLAKGKLFRVSLFKFSDDKYFCMLSNHHIILDGWSMPALLTDIHAIYLNLIDNEKIDINYNNCYSVAQKYLSENKNKNLNYWLNYISKYENNLDLSGLFKKDENRNSILLKNVSNNKNPLQSKITIQSKRYDKIKKLCNENQFTINAFLQFVWHKALSVFGNSNMTCVGTTVSGRNIPRDGIETTVGLFINTLPLICNHDDNFDTKVIDKIKEIQTHINEMNDRSEAHLSEIQNKGERLFDSIFVFESYPLFSSNEIKNRINIEIEMDDIFVSLDYPLTIIAYDENNVITFKIKYMGELFSESSINKLLSFMENIISQIVNDSNLKVLSLKFLNDDDYNNVFNMENPKKEEYFENSLINDFENNILKFKNNVALVFKNESLSYALLNEKSNQLANYLNKNLSISTTCLISLCLTRGFDMIISFLAIFKLGAAYVPIDPNYPLERINFIYKDSNSRLILVDNNTYEKVRKISDAKIINIADKNELKSIQSCTKNNLNKKVYSDDLAYILYTSGTTGTPKGVMMTQQSCYSRIMYMIQSNKMSEDDSFLFKTNIVFDVSFSDIFTSLLSGAKMYITESIFDIDEIEKIIIENKISICHFVPSQFKIFSEEKDFNKFETLNKIMFSGEAFHPNIVKKYINISRVFFNYYGPTETGEVTLKKYDYEDIKNFNYASNSSIGKAFPNLKIYILDKNLNILPKGAIGELYLSGIYLAEGYLNNLSLTKEKFILNPFSSKNEKYKYLYKTGDMVFELDNSEIEYIGRADSQVKIRGMRIELSEIENVIREYPLINQVAVLLKNCSNDSNKKIILAYYTSIEYIDEIILNNFILNKLPEYMLPNKYIKLDNIPLTNNGKLDTKKLPEPNFNDLLSHVAPNTRIEKSMCSIWESTLGLPKNSVGIQSDYYSLGGNSINAIKVVNTINKELSINVSLSDMLKLKSIKNILSNKNIYEISNIEIKKCDFTESNEYPASFMQEHLWHIEKSSEGFAGWNIPNIFEISEWVNTSSIKNALKNILSRQEILRTIIKEDSNGNVIQKILSESEFDFNVEEYEYISWDMMLDDLQKEFCNNFKINYEIPIRAKIFKLKDSDSSILKRFLIINVHHIAFDGWSIEVLLKELILFSSYFENKITETELRERLPQLNIHYKDYATWQRNYLVSDIIEAQIIFWKEKLKDYKMINLSPDKIMNEKHNFRGNHVYFTIDKKTSFGLRELAQKLEVSLFSICLSAYYLTLSFISGQKDIVIGSPVSNRHYKQISDVIGFFINIIAFRAKIDPEESLKSFIKSVGDELIAVQLCQDLPFDKLVMEVETHDVQSHHQIFNVSFLLQTFGHKIINNQEVQIFSLDRNLEKLLNDLYSPAKFDLNCFIDDSQDELVGMFNYSVQLFYENTIIRYVEIYKKTLSKLLLINKNDIKIKDIG
ncbi:non-ribosomal peptide synthetase [Silvanigrella aquatica]|uniref:Carrier domain-containing protein n=1 Tax=Silvanigrella aquatica TaxID=1915309 RepID=A0A1L4D3G7_9BACT|nr:non-ribosomal peptide synthetase [Silvanigrella aquatica]APJ04727.1 hypothetical protein AXG55_12805 [Silvanigrella aquatica]